MTIVFMFSMALAVAMVMCILVLGVTYLIEKILLSIRGNSDDWCLDIYSSSDIQKENSSKEIDSNDESRSSNGSSEEDEH